MHEVSSFVSIVDFSLWHEVSSFVSSLKLLEFFLLRWHLGVI